MPHMNSRTSTPFALIVAVLIAAAAVAFANGAGSQDLTPRVSSGLVLRAL